MYQICLPQFDITKFRANLDLYRKEYNLQTSLIQKYYRDRENRSTNVNYGSELFNVRLFKTNITQDNISKKKIYLVVPSLFNSANILDFSDNSSLIELLRVKGDVYLINWLEVGNQYLLEQYIDAVAELLLWLYNSSDGTQINLVGHCIGGNIALCSAKKAIDKLESIILLTTPWDFSHLKNKIQSALDFGVFDPVRKLDVIPELYVRLLFFLLFPKQFNRKLDKYFLASKEEQIKLLKMEYWLHSGVSLPNSLFFQIVENVVIGDKFTRMLSNGSTLENITCPVINIHAEKDLLAPKESSIPLVSKLAKVESLLMEGGHISYLIDDRIKIFSHL